MATCAKCGPTSWKKVHVSQGRARLAASIVEAYPQGRREIPLPSGKIEGLREVARSMKSLLGTPAWWG